MSGGVFHNPRRNGCIWALGCPQNTRSRYPHVLVLKNHRFVAAHFGQNQVPGSCRTAVHPPLGTQALPLSPPPGVLLDVHVQRVLGEHASRAVPLQHAHAVLGRVRQPHGFRPDRGRCLVSALQGDHPPLWLWVGGHAVGGWVRVDRSAMDSSGGGGEKGGSTSAQPFPPPSSDGSRRSPR